MIHRSYDAETLAETVKDFSKDWVGFDPKTLMADNPTLRKGDDFALFEDHGNGIYFGHYLFSSRGKKALEVAKDFLDYFFREYDVKGLYGLTPVNHAGAIWMNKKLGFEVLTTIETIKGPHFLVIFNTGVLYE